MQSLFNEYFKCIQLWNMMVYRLGVFFEILKLSTEIDWIIYKIFAVQIMISLLLLLEYWDKLAKFLNLKSHIISMLYN